MPIQEWLLELNRGFFVREAFHDNCMKLLQCTPFIGAGMSVALGFPTWVGFLKDIAEQLNLTDAVELLPQLFGNRYVITTNYDNVLCSAGKLKPISNSQKAI